MKDFSQKSKEKIITILLPILSTIFILGISLLIYFFSKGYRINIPEGQITKTGVLTVKTDPLTASLFINNESSGRTPNSKSLDIGDYDVSVRKDKYFDWNQKVSVQEEISTLVFPWLVLKDPEKTEKWNSSSTLISSWTSKDYNTIVFLLKDTEEKFTLWNYKVNTSLWDFSSNPSEIISLENNKFELTISPNGQYAILKLTSTPEKIYILETQKSNTLENAKTFDISNYKKYSIKWAEDNNHIILESSKEILSYDTIRQNIYKIVEKGTDKKYIWSTDKEGFFYLITNSTQEFENSYVYTLNQYKLDGTQQKTIIENIYLQKDKQYIDYYRTNGYTSTPFTNSVENTQTVGQVSEIKVFQDAKGAAIKTEYATYWYDINTSKYLMISPYSLNILDIAPDQKRILLTSDKDLLVFTFDKDEADHTEEIGTKVILQIENTKDIRWISNSTNIYFQKDNHFYIADKAGTNQYQIIDTTNIKNAIVKNSRESIVTLEVGTDNKVYINEYKIH
jgi:hypothetical protein